MLKVQNDKEHKEQNNYNKSCFATVLPSSFFRNSLQELCNMNKRYCGFVVAEITERFRRNMFLGTSLCHLHAFVCDFHTVC